MKAPHKTAFLFLCAAFIVSGTYQYYRSTINEIPKFDAFGLIEIGVYALLIGISTISLINKNWASIFIICFCLIGYVVAFSYYFPVVFSSRNNNIIDIGESIVYLGLILLAVIWSFLAIKKRKQIKL